MGAANSTTSAKVATGNSTPTMVPVTARPTTVPAVPPVAVSSPQPELLVPASPTPVASSTSLVNASVPKETTGTMFKPSPLSTQTSSVPKTTALATFLPLPIQDESNSGAKNEKDLPIQTKTRTNETFLPSINTASNSTPVITKSVLRPANPSVTALINIPTIQTVPVQQTPSADPNFHSSTGSGLSSGSFLTSTSIFLLIAAAILFLILCLLPIYWKTSNKKYSGSSIEKGDQPIDGKQKVVSPVMIESILTESFYTPATTKYVDTLSKPHRVTIEDQEYIMAGPLSIAGTVSPLHISGVHSRLSNQPEVEISDILTTGSDSVKTMSNYTKASTNWDSDKHSSAPSAPYSML